MTDQERAIADKDRDAAKQAIVNELWRKCSLCNNREWNDGYCFYCDANTEPQK